MILFFISALFGISVAEFALMPSYLGAAESLLAFYGVWRMCR